MTKKEKGAGTGQAKTKPPEKGKTALDKAYDALMGSDATVTVLKGDEELFAHIGKILNRKD
jgi:hypothetical protein